MNIEDRIQNSINTLWIAGFHHKLQTDKIMSCLLHLYGDENLALAMGLNKESSLCDIMEKLRDYVYNEKWRKI